MSEHDQQGEQERERVEDLEVKEAQAADVQGGAGSTTPAATIGRRRASR